MVVRRWLLYAFGAPDVPMLKIGRAYDDPTATHVRRAKGNTNATWMNDIAMGTELRIPDPRPGILRQILVETETVHVSPPMPPWAVHGYPTVAKRRSTTYRVCTPYGEYG